jgi:hypothetical protein
MQLTPGTDVDLARALERGEIPNGGFAHASHLRVAWVYLHESATVDEAAARIASTLRRFAASVGRSEKYHETITVFWMRALAAARSAMFGATLDEVLRANPHLLDKGLLLAYYSTDRLFSEEARLGRSGSSAVMIDGPAPRSAPSSSDPPRRPLSRRPA